MSISRGGNARRLGWKMEDLCVRTELAEAVGGSPGSSNRCFTFTSATKKNSVLGTEPNSKS